MRSLPAPESRGERVPAPFSGERYALRCGSRLDIAGELDFAGDPCIGLYGYLPGLRAQPTATAWRISAWRCDPDWPTPISSNLPLSAVMLPK